MYPQKFSTKIPHPSGEGLEVASGCSDEVSVDTYGGMVKVKWDESSPMTPFGQLAFFINFLKVAELFKPWVDDCPLSYTSPNAPNKGDILGTAFLSVLAGQFRYAHVTAIRNDKVSPKLLGMEKVVSEDSLRRAFIGGDENEYERWASIHLQKTYEMLLSEPYILDLDTTVKPLYGKQEGAVIGYNPKKPGRPSHAYHSYFIANLRLVLWLDVLPGNESGGCYSRPGLWSLLERLPSNCCPSFIRGDIGYGNEGMMSDCENRTVDYLLKLKITSKVKKLMKLIAQEQTQWEQAGQGWEGKESVLELQGWSKARRVIILRRLISEKHEEKKIGPGSQRSFPFQEVFPVGNNYEYAVLVTSLKDEILTIAHHYRDRGDAENNFDELKNQWGWGGFSTKDMKRTRIMARIVAQVFNWWTIFARLAVPNKHIEGITSRPLLLFSIGRQTQHSGQTTLYVNSNHGKKEQLKKVMTRISAFLKAISRKAEQLNQLQKWCLILSVAFRKFLNGRVLSIPPPLRS